MHSLDKSVHNHKLLTMSYEFCVKEYIFILNYAHSTKDRNTFYRKKYRYRGLRTFPVHTGGWQCRNWTDLIVSELLSLWEIKNLKYMARYLIVLLRHKIYIYLSGCVFFWLLRRSKSFALLLGQDLGTSPQVQKQQIWRDWMKTLFKFWLWPCSTRISEIWEN